MKTLLSTAALAAILISGVALADGNSMSADKGMSGPQSYMQNGAKQHMGKGMRAGMERQSSSGRNYMDEDHRGESRYGEGHAGQRHADDDDQDGRHMKNLEHDRS